MQSGAEIVKVEAHDVAVLRAFGPQRFHALMAQAAIELLLVGIEARRQADQRGGEERSRQYRKQHGCQVPPNA